MTSSINPQEAIAKHLYTTLANDTKKLADNLKNWVKQTNEVIHKCSSIAPSLDEDEMSFSKHIKERLMELRTPLEKLMNEVTDIAKESRNEIQALQYHEVYY